MGSWAANRAILRTAVAEKLTYRTDFVFSTVIRFLPLLTQVFLWGAIFGVGTTAPRDSIGGYTYGAMVAYYLLAMLTRAFSSMPGLAGGIARDVREGTVNRFLVQPVDLLGFLFWQRVAHKAVYYLIAAAPFALMFWYFRADFPPAPDGPRVAAFVASLVMAFLLGFLIESLLGLVAFWFLEVSSLLFIYQLLNYFLSGHMIPLDFLPAEVAGWIQLLPFQFLAYVPPAIWLGKIPDGELMTTLLDEAAWVVALWAAGRWVLARGLRRYGAFGG